eukprot:scaffold8003_cov255-Prasinococcus_capsulatus_cf.AAC.2
MMNGVESGPTTARQPAEEVIALEINAIQTLSTDAPTGPPEGARRRVLFDTEPLERDTCRSEWRPSWCCPSYPGR